MAIRRSGSWASLFFLLALLGFVDACSGARFHVQRENVPLAAEGLSERVSLGYLGAFAEQAGGSERLRDAATLAAKLGNGGEASSFAREQLDLARGQLMIVRLRGGDEKDFDRAIQELDQAADFAVDIGDEVFDPNLVVEAAQFLIAPKRQRKLIARALGVAREADISWGYARLWTAFETDPHALTALQRLRWRSFRGAGLPAGSPRISPESLAQAGSAGTDIMRVEANRAATSQRKLDLRRWLDAMLEVDRHDYHALAASAVLDALERGDIREDEALLPDLAGNSADPLGGRARMMLRHDEHPESLALALYRSEAMVVQGTFGDAGQLLDTLDLDGATATERALHGELFALVALESGTERGRSAFLAWRRKAHAQHSSTVAAWVSDYEQEQAPAGHLELAHAADHELISAGNGHNAPRLAPAVLWSAAVDKNSTKHARDLALAAIAGRDPSHGARLAICRERKLFDDDCRELLDELSKLDYANTEYVNGLDALGDSANVRASWFSQVPWLEAEELPRVRERLLGYEGTRVSATTDYQAGALFSELAANRPDLARLRIQTNGAILRPETRAIASMALRDLEDGLVEPREMPNLLLELPSADIDASWFLESWLPGDIETVAELFPGKSRLARFARGLAFARMGAWQPATAELLLVVDELDGAAKGVVAGRLALAAQLSHQVSLRDQALSVAEAEAPESFMPVYVRARIYEAALDYEAAHELYLEALTRRPRAQPAFEGALRTLAIPKRDLDRVRDALLLYPDAGTHWRASELLESAARDELDGMLFTNLWLARNDAATLLSIGEPAAKIGPLAERGFERILEELQLAPDPAGAFPLAAKALAWLGAMPTEVRVDYREVELWLTYLIGRDEDLLALSEARPRYGGFYEPPARLHSTLLLAAARKQRAIDDLLSWAIVREELWDADDASTRALIGELYAPIEDTNLAQYACLRMFQRDEFDIAAERCIPLWDTLGGSAFLAVDLAYLALNDPELARAHGMDFGEFFATADSLDLLESDPVWLLNASLRQSKLGNDEIGAQLRTRQLALDAIATEPDTIELGQGRFRGPLLRQQIMDQFEPVDRRRFALAAGSAVRSLDLIAAELYARRLLAWLPPLALDSQDPEFTARSPQMLAASRAEGETSDEDLRSSGLYVLAVSSMIEADLDAERIPREAMLELFDTYAEDHGHGALARLVSDNPESHTAKLLLLSEYADAHDRDAALPLARELIALDPDNPLVLANALPQLIDAEDLPEAKRLLAEGRTLFPGHPWLRDEALPALLTGSDGAMPGWLRSPDDFDAKLAAISDAQLDSLSPTRSADVEVSAEVFFPSAVELSAEGLSAREDIPGFVLDPEDADAMIQSRALFLIREPRASRCEGLACAEPVLADWNSRNFATLWVRELEVPAGDAIEFVVSDGESIINSVMIPTGGNVFLLLAGTRVADMGDFLPYLKLMRESFRPLDWSLAAEAAETMRAAGSRPPEDSLRLAGRRALARAGNGDGIADSCILAEQPGFGALAPDARAELLLDLFLTTRNGDQRRGLLACTEPAKPEAARLALLALLDEDAAVHRFGREATQIHHGQVLTDTRRILYTEQQPAISNPALTLGSEQPAFGLLQVIAALPDQQSRDLTRALLGRRDPRLRAIALAASGTMDYFGTPAEPLATASRTEVERLREVVRDGEAKDALLATRSLMDVPGAENIAALRERADSLSREDIADASSRGLAGDLAWGLAQQLDAKDQKRILALAKAIDLDPSDGATESAKNTRESLEQMAEDHAEARSLVRKRGAEIDSQRISRWVRGKTKAPAPRTAAEVSDASLAELAPGNSWTFVRVANAGLFAANLEGLLSRLAPANPSDAYLVRALIHDALLQGSFALLREEGGLDLSKAIECVSPKDSSTFACSATVSDPDAALSVLARRELGDDAGLALPMDLATEFAGLPVMLGMLPIALHSLVEAPEDQLDNNDSVRIAAERLRRTRTVAGHELEYYATVELSEDHLVVDSEHYMLLGDRLFVFSSVDMAEKLLRKTPAGVDALAEDPRFRSTVQDWRDGVALQAVDFTEELGLPQMSLEVVLDNEGMVFNAHGYGDRKAIGDFGELGRLLPREPVAAAAVALEPDALREYFEDTDVARCSGHGANPDGEASTEDGSDDPDDERCGLSADDKFPPIDLAEAASAALLGWYPEPGNSLWQDWVLVMPLDRQLTRAAKRLRIPLPAAGEQSEHAGLVWVVRDGALVVSSSARLAEAVLAQPAPPPGEEQRPTFADFSLDGQRAAEAVRGLADRYEGEQRGNYLRVIATIIGLVNQVELHGEWGENENEDGVLSATIALNLAESEEELALINRWLASPEVSNASKLPRRLSQSETEGGLVYTLEVKEAAQFAKNAIPTDNPRISVEVVDADTLRMTVLPSRAVASTTTQPLTASEREDMLDDDNMIRAADPKIREQANALRVSGNDAATVEAVVSWVHEHVNYEITPTSLDAVAILDRATGDCTEYALLTVTLLRAAGIPARLQEGMAASGDEMVAHAWVAWHDGTRWREVDPTAGSASVSAGHLELEVVDVLAMISLGQFEVTAIDKLDP